MSDQRWEPGQIYAAWREIHRALLEVTKRLPRQTLVFLAKKASDGIIRFHAAQVLDWQDNRHVLPDWGWTVADDKERHRGSCEQVCALSGA